MGTVSPKLWTPHEYQLTAERFIYHRTICRGVAGGAALFLDPGLGKTAVCLQAFQTMKQTGYIRRALVVAPKRVCTHVWPDERKKWTNFEGVSIGLATGTVSNRRKILSMPFDIHIISRDCLDWLADLCRGKRGSLPWQMIIFDESTSFKTWSSVRSKAAQSIVPRIPYRLILTGTPSPKDITDLYPQIWLLDEGESLGQDVTEFRRRYCQTEHRQGRTSITVRKNKVAEIQNAIAPMCLRLDIKDYLSMPDMVVNDVWVDLPPAARTHYKAAEDELLVELDTGEARAVGRAGGLYSVCKQLANGGIYDNEKVAHQIHMEKVDAAWEITQELQGKPVLIAYQYRHDIPRLKARFKGITVIEGGMAKKPFDAAIQGWNEGTLDPPYLAVHPDALSYGLNMQYGEGRDIIWLGLPDSLELYQQLNARIWRQGVTSKVRIHRILTEDTVDSVVVDRTDRKIDVQSNLLTVLKQYAALRHSESPIEAPSPNAVPQSPGKLCLLEHSGW